MANQTQDVELRIRASNYSKQTTDQVTDALKKMTAAQDAQIEAAKNGTVTVQQLEKSYSDLEAAAKALLGQNSLIKLFQSQSQTLTELEAKLAAARKAQQDYINSSGKAAQQGMSYREFTSQRMADYMKSEGSHAAAMKRISTEWAEYKAQVAAAGGAQTQSADQARKLASAVASAEKELARAQGRVESTQKRMAEFGITSLNAAEQQQKIVSAVNSANVALARQEAAIGAHDAHAASRKAQADAIAQREVQVKVDNIFAQAERDVAAALEAERKAQQAANQVANDKNRERQVEVDVLFAQAQRQAAEELNKKTAAINAQKAALQAAADQAERMTRGANTTARGTIPVSMPNLAAQIRDIQNPSEAAVRSVEGIEQAVAKLEERVASIRGPVKDYRSAVEEVTRVQKALANVAGDVDAYQRQIAAVRAARTEFVAARTDVNRLIAELRSGNAGDDVTTRLTRAQNTMQQAAQRLGNLTTAARQMRGELQIAGVDTNNLAGAEQGLIAQANRATTALNTLNTAFRQHGSAAEDSGSRLWRWFGGGNGRTTLSYMQRMRGEMLSMVAGFVGLNAAIELARKTLDVFNESQAIMNRLIVANGGNVRAAADDYKYLQAQTDRIGVSFEKAAPAFAKFAIAARTAGMNTQQIRYIFEGFATATSRLGLSAIDTERAFKAIEQMFNKGKVQAEELTQQLGDVLPGAMNLFAKAQGVTTDQFMKLMEQGQIGPQILVAVARQLQQSYGSINSSTENLAQAQARFDNAAYRFFNNTAAGGFVDSYKKLLDKLTEMMNNGQADKFAAQLSAAFSALIDALITVSNNIDAITSAFKALIALKVAGWLLTLPSIIRAVRSEFALARAEVITFQTWLGRQQAAAALSTSLGATGLTGVLARLTPALAAAANGLILLQGALAVAGAAYAGWEIGKAGLDLFDNSERDKVKASIDATTKAFHNADKAQKEYEKTIGTENEARFKAQRDRFRQLAHDAQKAQDDAIKAAREGHFFSNGVANVMNDEIEAALARQSRILSGPQPGSNGGATPDPGDPSNERQRMAALQKQLDDEDKKNRRAMMLARLKAEKGDLAERLEIIKEPFDELKKKYREATKDDEEYQKAVQKIDASYAKAAALERQKYANEQNRQNESLAKRREALAQEIQMNLSKIEDEIAQKASHADPTEPYEKRRLDRVNAIAHAYDEVAKRIIKEAQINPAQAAKDKARLDALIRQRVELEGQNSDRDEANRLLDEYNKKQGILNNQIAAIKTQADLGFIDQAEAAKQISEQIKTWGPEIDAAGQEALKFAAFNANALDPTRFAEIVSTIRQGMARNNVDSQVAVTQMNAAQAQLNEMLAIQEREMDKIHLQRQIGALDAQQEVEAINATTAKYAGSIQYLAQELLNFIAIVREKKGMNPEELAAIEASATKVLKVSKANVQTAQEWENVLVQSVAQNGVNAFDQMAQSIGKVITGQQGIGEGFRGMLSAAGMFFASLLRDIGMAILRMQILKALQNMYPGSGIAAAAGSAMAGGHHNGGMAGSTPTFKRSVSASAFMGAVRYHTGGIAGFAPNEVPAVLQKGEEVLTRNDPRHVMNGGKGGSDTSIRAVLVDDPSRIPAAMASAAGEKTVLMHLKNNIPTIKQMLRG